MGDTQFDETVMPGLLARAKLLAALRGLQESVDRLGQRWTEIGDGLQIAPAPEAGGASRVFRVIEGDRR